MSALLALWNIVFVLSCSNMNQF